MQSLSTRRAPRPLNPTLLDELALAYVGRFATTRAKLRSYLARKLRERGWDGTEPPAIDAVADRCTQLGYVDDAAFALAKSRSLVGRGYGEKRVEQALRIAGVGEEDKASARALAAAQSVEAALRFAQRRRLGPYAPAAPDAKGRDRALSAMIRAGHSFALARAIVNQLPGSDIDADALSEHVRNPAE